MSDVAVLRNADGAREPSYDTMADIATQALRDAVVTGELAPGDALRPEHLARRLGMSASPVREALMRLESLGLAERAPRRSVRVRELTVQDLRDSYDLRLVIEPLAVSRAAERFKQADADKARTHLNAYQEANERNSLTEAREAHAGFHFAIYEASGSSWLVRAILPSWENCERYRLVSRAGLDVERRNEEHQQILEACIRHDPEAAVAALRTHLETTANLAARWMGVEADLYPESS
jgi:DNA-binding GntR family transcriptional regulator